VDSTELSPYHKELRQDLIDWELLRTGLDAYERISGVNADAALLQLGNSATQEQRERVISRATRAEEFYNLPAELQARLKRNEA
jgi:hypothetical protein